MNKVFLFIPTEGGAIAIIRDDGGKVSTELAASAGLPVEISHSESGTRVNQGELDVLIPAGLMDHMVDSPALLIAAGNGYEAAPVWRMELDRVALIEARAICRYISTKRA